ncbi:DUF3575 domain-containing protein [Flavobacterium seoulense]|uniref:DUF3575 domain-containing protein n=1 Tax=Flavobacterium seoulense TaxID=1492738 RepID=A0A066WN83_9FLAO|nr:DUF3575 domain-containing protein [Flavobacterium seoulense]KDN54063.1 hypothetical protein FEM21_28800 [Flavobacterium seoulense]
MKKAILFSLLVFISLVSRAQTYIKINGLSALVAVPQLGIETSIGAKSTFSIDGFASFWKSFDGKPMQALMITPEYRYHFHEKFNGFYTGFHFGGDVYKIQKWNYWGTNHYEKGLGYHIGATIGYQKRLSDKFVLDAFIGGGWHQGFYKGYYLDGTPGRYESVKNFNKSGEWLPYRGGIMISYKLN